MDCPTDAGKYYLCNMKGLYDLSMRQILHLLKTDCGDPETMDAGKQNVCTTNAASFPDRSEGY